MNTIGTYFKIYDRSNPYIYNSQESLILLLELLLIENLNGENAIFRRAPEDLSVPNRLGRVRGPYMSKLSFQYGFKVFLITEVVLVCSPPMVATANGSGNPRIAESAIQKRYVGRSY